MYPYRPTCIIALVLFYFSIAQAVGQATCVKFRLPAQKALISTPICTLGVDTSCKTVQKTEIRVRYIPVNADTAVEVTLNEKYYPKFPFQYIWDIKDVPNQLFFGLGVIIDVAFTDGTISSKRREGIFLAHQAISYPVQALMNYEVPGTKTFPRDTIVIPSTAITAFAQMYWNEKTISAKVTVKDASFRADAPVETLEKMGVEILLDPARKQKPYPTEEVMILVVPLAGKPYRIAYSPFFSDSGNFEPNATSSRINFECPVEKMDKQGFTVVIHIPRYLLGKTVPEEMGLNIVAKTLSDSGKIVTSSLINATGFNNHCPLLWGSIITVPKPVLKAQWLIWLAFFFAGLAIPFIVRFILLLTVKDRPKVLYIKHTKEEKAVFEKAKDAIDRLITNKNMTIQDITNEIQISPQRLEKIIRKVTSISYRNYIGYLRAEIVCERLRSSYSGEEAIAESCGFASAREMAQTFKKYHHMAPAAYRKIQQVSK